MGQIYNPPADYVPPVEYTDGNYAGNDAANRAIPHGLGEIPYLVIIWESASGTVAVDVNRAADAIVVNLYTNTGQTVTKATTTNFYVGNAASYPQSMNANGTTYYWRAFKAA